jgi:predicted O-methyltransferase YrrM
VHELTEARFTPPTDFCPHPEYWKSADSDSTEFEVLELIGALVRALQPEIVVETGSAFGYGSREIGKALKRNQHGRLYSLERDPERVAIARLRCQGLPVEIVQTESLAWAPPGPIGFAFFDSLTNLRVPEFLRYRPFMRPGTTVAFHDAAPHHDLYDRWLRPLESSGAVKMIRLHNPRGLVLAEVL